MSITLLREVTERVQPPRALAVDRPLGFPLGEPDNPAMQKNIVMAAFESLVRSVQEPLIVHFRETF